MITLILHNPRTNEIGELTVVAGDALAVGATAMQHGLTILDERFLSGK